MHRSRQYAWSVANRKIHYFGFRCHKEKIIQITWATGEISQEGYGSDQAKIRHRQPAPESEFSHDDGSDDSGEPNAIDQHSDESEQTEKSLHAGPEAVSSCPHSDERPTIRTAVHFLHRCY